MKIFISGGCKNGKSYYAQRLAANQQAHPLYYVATMAPVDSEDDERIKRHRLERSGWGFITVEQPASIEKILDKCDPQGSFLLDSLTALLANEMFGADGGVDERAAERVANGISLLLADVGNIVIVSDYIYSDALLYDHDTEIYRKSLALVDRTAAKSSDVVLEIAYSGVMTHKGLDRIREFL